ncbi:Uu.00g067140.m01.CDS01 [Anthostomella pinea]|uniref:Uu.00g067140.m01.CDS01 n=1 Tax=Anthostomella pinea TaxID=933095 RepID=A0AAI8YN83_9PEZI|nr:Uu.00g067140.m01.CDS01 [Anthostomella pinea]
MTDLSRILPEFPLAQYARLLPAIEKHQLTITDLLTLEFPDIGKRTQLPLLDIKRLCNAVLEALHKDLGVADSPAPGKQSGGSALRHTGSELVAKPWNTISTLDKSLDEALGGGIPSGYITEITGESGAGKTQFLLTLLLSAQLPPPHGLGRPALYISTEAPLSTKRLSQILTNNPFFQDLDSSTKPSLDQIISTVTPDLESQDHILTYQVPVEVSRRNIGLIVLDSVAANYRAEFERGPGGSSGGSNMAARGNELVRLGQLLHELARKHDLAVVVANQVADRFTNFSPAVPKSSGLPFSLPLSGRAPPVSQESPLASRSRKLALGSGLGSTQPQLPSHITAEPTSSMADVVVRSSMPEPPPDDVGHSFAPPALLLDHQQRWFTGWGDDPHADQQLKTPSLGLVWSTQIATRIALFRRPAYGRKEVIEDEETGSATIRSWRRCMKVVFAPHVAGTGPGLEGAVEFEVTMGGLRAVERGKKGKAKEREV